MLKHFHSAKFDSFLNLIISLLLFTFIFSLSSCTTTNTYTIKEPKTISHDESIAVKKVIMKDSTIYNFKENEAVYKKKYKDTSEVIVCTSDKIVTDSITHNTGYDKYLLFLKDISAISYKRTYVPDGVMFAFAITGGLLIIALIIFFTAGGFKMNLSGG
jgi:hypothetical protein